MGRKRLTIEQVKEQFEKRNFVLKSTEYKGTYNKLEVVCPKRHNISMSYNNFQQGNGCHVCYADSKRLTINYIKEQFEKRNYKLWSKTYVNSWTPLEVTCPEGHEIKMRYGNFQQGNECHICNVNSKRLTIDQVRQQFENKNYILRSEVYMNSWSKLEVTCPEGHDYNVAYNTFQQGHGCPECYGNQKYTVETVKNSMENDGTELLSANYLGANSNLEWKCSSGHLYKATWNNFQHNNSRCPECNKHKVTSKGEISVQRFVKTLVNNVICNDKTQILNAKTGRFLELDVWLPDLNKAIEYNGNYFHSFEDAILRDKIKQEECKKLGIDLLIIWDKDYTDNKQHELQKIKEFIT